MSNAENGLPEAVTTTVLQPLPGGRREPFAVWRIAMGFVDERGLPRRSDYFRVCRKEKVGERWTWVQDDEAQEWMCAAAGAAGDPDPQHPTRIPVIFPHHGYVSGDGNWVPASSRIYRAMALFTSSYRVCACERFTEKPEATCREQELPWPPPSYDIYERPMRREYYWSPGEDAVRLYYRKDSEGNLNIKRRENLRCDPALCEFSNKATEDGLVKLKGNAGSLVGKELCKPQVVCPLILPWIEHGSPHAKLTSSGKNTAFVLPASLDDIETMVGRAPIPLLDDGAGNPGLLLVMKRPPLQTPSGRFELPVAEFEARAQYLELPKIGGRIVAQLAESQSDRKLLDQYQAAGQGIVKADIADDAATFAHEFHPEVTGAEFADESSDEKYERLAGELDWSGAQTGATWDAMLVNGEIDGKAMDTQLADMVKELAKTVSTEAEATEPQRLFAEEGDND